jgi:predicted enzyme related to lactoylglutathione lyase
VAEFYKILGWKIQKWEGLVDYWLISTGENSEPGINGGSILVPKRARPCVGYQAHFMDPEWNVIGIMENDPSAR